MSGAVIPVVVAIAGTVVAVVALFAVVSRAGRIPAVIGLLPRRAVAPVPPSASPPPPSGPLRRALRPARLRRATSHVVQMHSMSSGVALSIRSRRSMTRGGRLPRARPAAGPPPETRGGGTVAAFEKAAP